MKKVSVIIPCYNTSSYLDKCLSSLLNQTMAFEDIEVILIDDASSDDTLSVLYTWQEKYPKSIRVFHFDENSRQGTARNLGVKKSTAPYIFFLDSDDWLEKDALSHMYDTALSYDFDLVVCRYERDFGAGDMYFDSLETGEASRGMTIDSTDKRKAFIFLHPVDSTPCFKLIKKSILIDNDIYFPEKIRYEDNFWAPLLFLYVKKIYILEEKLYHYYVNENSTVLKKDADYHTDLLTAHVLLWDEYINRHMLKDYYLELSKEYLITCYLGFLKVLANRYEHPSYEHYESLRDIVLSRIPDYKENPYISPKEIGALHSALIKTLDYKLTEAEFIKLLDSIRLSGL